LVLKWMGNRTSHHFNPCFVKKHCPRRMKKLTSRTRVYSLGERWFIPPGWKYCFPTNR
jgi:hypothetical protein